jgi:hypothetical protein
MRVEVTEDRLSTKDRETGRLYVQEKGDIITVPDALGERWCGLGWAKDVAGKVATGERKPGVVTLDVHNAKIAGGSHG